MEIVVALIVFGCAVYLYLQKIRRDELMKKYNDAELVDKLMRRLVWQDQTADQLIDSVGKPIKVDKRVMASRTREVWKYDRRSTHRFGMRITLVFPA